MKKEGEVVDNRCKYCGKESYGRPFCSECGKKYFNFTEPINISSSKTNKQKNDKPRTKEEYILITRQENSKRKCAYCDKNALIGKAYCQEHYDEYIKEQEKQYYNQLNKITEQIIKNASEYSYIKTHRNNKICDICGACSYDKPYCYSCYNSFILENNSNSFVRFEGAKKFVCKSGIKVRSISEREISDFLTENKIPHIYEQELKYQFFHYLYDRTFAKSLHPDFYIPGPIRFKNRLIKDVYIEFWGFDEKNIEYTNTKKFKLNIYKELGITLINMDSNDINDVNKSLTYKLLNYNNKQINF